MTKRRDVNENWEPTRLNCEIVEWRSLKVVRDDIIQWIKCEWTTIISNNKPVVKSDLLFVN